MKPITLVLPYYENPGMLRIHHEAWAKYPDELKQRLHDIVHAHRRLLHKSIAQHQPKEHALNFTVEHTQLLVPARPHRRPCLPAGAGAGIQWRLGGA